MELDLPFGPWKEIASAEWNGVPTAIYINPLKTILLVAFSKEGPGAVNAEAQGKPSPESLEVSAAKQGVLVLMKKPLLLEGPITGIEKFLQNQKRDLSFIQKIIERQHYSYVLLEAQPFFVEFRKEELVKAVKEQTAELDALVKVTFDVATNYGCKARELSKAEDSVSENLIGDPLMLFALGGSKTRKYFSPIESRRETLGFSVESKNPVDISTSEMQTTVVTGGSSAQDRLAAMQVCIENLLISGVPCFIAGNTSFLEGLAFPSKAPLELEKAGLPKPSGFPLKSYSLGKGFLIDLTFVSPASFARLLIPPELLGVVDGVWGESSLAGLREKLEAQDKKYAVSKAIRVLKVAEKEYSSSFGTNAIDDLKNPWSEKSGNALFIDVGENPDLYSLAVESLLNSLGEPKLDSSIGIAVESDFSLLAPEAMAALSSLQDKVFFILNTQSADALEQTKELAPTLVIELLGSNAEAVASFAGEKKRIVLRPLFSSVPAGKA